eukprot:scaffold309368_cov14-Tisochrysis_lutea.AAC.1
MAACSAALLSTLPSVVDPSDAPFVATRVAKPGLPVLRAHGLIAAFDAAENQLSEHVHAAAHAGQLLPPDALLLARAMSGSTRFSIQTVALLVSFCAQQLL